MKTINKRLRVCVIAAALSFTWLFSTLGNPSARADTNLSDNLAPALVSATIANNSLYEGQKTTVTLVIRDDKNVLKSWPVAVWTPPSDAPGSIQNGNYFTGGKGLVSTDSINGYVEQKFEFELTAPNWPGEYKQLNIQGVIDANGNGAGYDLSACTNRNIYKNPPIAFGSLQPVCQLSFSVHTPSASESAQLISQNGPVLNKISFTPQSINTFQNNQLVTVNIETKDGSSDVNYVPIWIPDDTSLKSTGGDIPVSKTFDGTYYYDDFTIILNFPKGFTQGSIPLLIRLDDALGHQHVYGSTSIASGDPFPTGLTPLVISNNYAGTVGPTPISSPTPNPQDNQTLVANEIADPTFQSYLAKLTIAQETLKTLILTLKRQPDSSGFGLDSPSIQDLLKFDPKAVISDPVGINSVVTTMAIDIQQINSLVAKLKPLIAPITLKAKPATTAIKCLKGKTIIEVPSKSPICPKGYHKI